MEGLLKLILEKWHKFDKPTRRIMRIALIFIIAVFLYGFGAFLTDKYYYNKPAQYLWLYNYVKPDSVRVPVEKIVYIHDTINQVGRDEYNSQRDQTINHPEYK